jgi:hypothetical protein
MCFVHRYGLSEAKRLRRQILAVTESLEQDSGMGVRVVDKQALSYTCGVELLISGDQCDVAQTGGPSQAMQRQRGR